MFIGMKHISPTFRYIIPMYLRLTTFTKTLPQMPFHLCFAIFFRSVARLITLLTAGGLTDLQLPATALNMCTTDARLGGVGRMPPPPQTKILATPVARGLPPLTADCLQSSLSFIRSTEGKCWPPCVIFRIDMTRGPEALN